LLNVRYYIKISALPIESVLKGVSRSVKKAINNEAWVETFFDGEFSFFAKKWFVMLRISDFLLQRLVFM